jgi:hypothetical protein
MHMDKQIENESLSEEVMPDAQVHVREEQPAPSQTSRLDLCPPDEQFDVNDETCWKNLRRLGRTASWDDALEYLWKFSSYARTEPMAYLMCCAPALRRMQIFLEIGNMCDAPWPYRSRIAEDLRAALAKVPLVGLLSPAARSFYEALPDLVPIWRGREAGRERGLHWTIRRALAEDFARGKRCWNRNPTLVSAEIPKQHILAVFVSRDEDEIVVDPRRLRNVRKETVQPFR